MRQVIVIVSLFLLLSACVSSETTVTKKEVGAGHKTAFDYEGAADTRVKLALLYLQKNNMQKAKENIEKALEYQPNDANVYRVFAYYYQRVKEYDKAEALYKKSLSLDGKNPDTYNNYGTFLCRQGRYQEAEKAFLSAVRQTTYSAVANTYENAGICSEKAGDVDKAIYYYQYALSHDPRKSYIHLILAKLYIDNKNYDAARLSLINFQKNNKVSAESLWQWIRLSYATEKNASLNKYAGKLLAEFPESQQALDYLNHDYYQ
jgi:type IV pilus assembly protein PilF